MECVRYPEWLKLVNSIDSLRDRAIIGIIYHTACSENELINIKVDDIDFNNPSINFSDRSSSIPARILIWIEDYIRSKENLSSKYLFSTRQSSFMTSKRIQQILLSYSKSILGYKITPLDVRYTHIYHALDKGIALPAIINHTGISYKKMVQIIEHLEPYLKNNIYRYEL